MRAWVRTHVGLFGLVITTIAGSIGIAAALNPALNEWMRSHPLVGWVWAIVATALTIDLWVLWDRAMEAAGSSQSHLESEARDKLDQATQNHQQEISDRDATIANLTARLNPTLRDRNQYKWIDRLAPLDSGAIRWLTDGFNAKSWTKADTETLDSLFYDRREMFFDDQEVDESFKALRAAIHKFETWMMQHGGIDQEFNPDLPNGAPAVYTVRDGATRAGGWNEFDKIRDEGLACASDIVTNRRFFERVARQRGL